VAEAFVIIGRLSAVYGQVIYSAAPNGLLSAMEMAGDRSIASWVWRVRQLQEGVHNQGESLVGLDTVPGNLVSGLRTRYEWKLGRGMIWRVSGHSRGSHCLATLFSPAVETAVSFWDGAYLVDLNMGWELGGIPRTFPSSGICRCMKWRGQCQSLSDPEERRTI